MNPWENRITKVTQLMQRDDGSEARIVATACFGAGLHMSIDVYVHRRPNAEAPWELCSQDPHPDWKTMSVADYIDHGRSPMLRTVSQGEILRATSMIGQPMP